MRREDSWPGLGEALEAASCGVLVIRQGRVAYGNAAAGTLLGCGDTAGRPADTLVPRSNDCVCFWREVEPSVRRGERVRRECEFTDAAGNYRCLLIEAAALPGSPEAQAGVMTISDVTELKRREGELRRQAEHLRLAQDATGMVAFVWEVGPDLIHWSSDPQPLFGPRPPGGYPLFREMVHPDDREAWLERRNAALATGRGSRHEFRFRRTDGEERWMACRDQVFADERGESTHMLVVMQDVTERKRAEQALREAKEAAEKADRAKSAFLAAMSHEIRTPMSGVIGLADLLIGSGLDRDQRALAETLGTSARSLLQIINDIVDLSRIEAGRVDLEPAPFSPRAVVEEVVALFAEPARRRQLGLSAEIDPSLPASVCGDAGRVRQILTNLVANGIKFTEHGSVRVIATGGRRDDALELRLAVADTGPGIDPPTMEELFAPYAQGAAASARRADGSGLGLAISRRLARLMGGDIEVATQAGEGSEFAFRCAFPIDPPGRQESSAEVRPRARSRPRLNAAVLLVEDNDVNRQVASALLESLGCTVETAADGLEGLAAIARGRFDVVLMDCLMPNLDGYQTVRRLRQIERDSGAQRRLPVIAVTAIAMAGDRERCLEAGFDAYVSKPYTPEELIDAIRRILAPA